MIKDFIVGFFKGILGVVRFIIGMVLIIILAIATMFFFGISSIALTGYKEYIVISIPGSSFFIAMGIIYFWCFFIYLIVMNKRENKRIEKEIAKIEDAFDYNNDDYQDIEYEEDDDDIRQDKRFQLLIKVYDFFHNFKYKKQIVVVLIIISSLGFFYSYRTFNVVTEDKIIMHSVFNLRGRIYSYNDVAEIYTGITEDKDNNLYYKIKLKDGNIINLIDASMDSDNDCYELSIYKIDKKLLQIGVNKNIDLKNLSKFESQGLNEQYVENVKRILEIEL